MFTVDSKESKQAAFVPMIFAIDEPLLNQNPNYKKYLILINKYNNNLKCITSK